jgi:hypothetical protein
MAFTTPRTWTIGEFVTKSIMDAHVRDNLNAIWVGTTVGDLDYYTSATAKARLAKGTALQQLKMNSAATAPEWVSAISVPTSVISGDILYANSTSAVVSLAKGTALQQLKMNAGATAPEWVSAISVPTTVVAGDILYANSTSAVISLAKGTAGQFLKSDGSVPSWAPVVIKRQGGSATNWNSPGTTTYTPTVAKIQTGVVRFSSISSAVGSYYYQTITVTYPEAFTYIPHIICSIMAIGTPAYLLSAQTATIGTTTCVFYIISSNSTAADLSWTAIGE